MEGTKNISCIYCGVDVNNDLSEGGDTVNDMSSHEILKKYIGMDLIEFFVRRIKIHSDICIFGYGGDGRKIYECMINNSISVSCICDNNWSQITDASVMPVEKAVKEYPQALFVVASHLYSCAMELQLISLGISENKIISFDESTEMSYRELLPLSAYGEMVSAMHYEATGHYPNLDYPKSFNEKMMVAMIAEPEKLKKELTDKIKVRSWVEKKISGKYLIPLIGQWDKVDDIPWCCLPKKYALKLNHGCGLNILSNGKDKVDISLAQRKLKTWMKCNHGYIAFERHYIPIKPRILCEKYIENVDDDVYDYKIFCFHGEPQYIMFLYGRKKGLKMIFLDLTWNALPFVYSFPRGDKIPPKPKKLEEMISLTRTLCAGFDHVRVDWYVLNDGSIKFGEMTFTSAGGHAAWDPPEIDMELGKLW